MKQTAAHFIDQIAICLLVMALIFSPAAGARVQAEGSREIVASGGARALSEWRSSSYGNLLLRRTFYQVYANAGEVIFMGSSGMAVPGASDIVLFKPGRINSFTESQQVLLPAPDFKCTNYRALPGNGAAGVLNTRAKELAGPLPSAGGYTPCLYTAPVAGVYWVAFYGPNGRTDDIDGNNPGSIAAPNITANQNSGVSLWDLTVRSSAASTTDIKGRVWTDYMTLFTTGNGAAYRLQSNVYALTRDGFKYAIDLNGLDGNGFILYGNTVGFLNPDNATPLYHDVVSGDAPLSQGSNQLYNPQGGAMLALPTVKLFLNPPAEDLPVYLAPTPVVPDLSDISFVGSASSNSAYYNLGGDFYFTSNTGGIVEAIITRDGIDFDPTKPTNRVLRAEAAAGARQIHWDGLDNSGNPFPVGSSYPYQITLHGGELHFPLLDAENSVRGGPSITLLNPPSGLCMLYYGCSTAFYDDRGYRTTSGVNVGTVNATLPGGGAPATNRSDPFNGFNSTTPQRGYGTDGSLGFGDGKGLDLWTFYPSVVITATLGVIAANPSADLAIDLTHSGDFSIGGTGNFTMEVKNVGGATFTPTVSVTDTFPAGIAPTLASGDGWACSTAGQTVTCTNFADIAAGASLPPISVTTSVSSSLAPGTLSDTATITNDDGNPVNNSDTDTVNLVTSADLGVTKSVPSPYVTNGGTVTFTMTATNDGPSNATNAQLTDSLPAGLTYVSNTASQGTYTPGTGVWAIGALADGDSATLTLTANVTAAAGTDLFNTAGSLASDQTDPNPANNSASAAVHVRNAKDIGIVLSHPADFTVGNGGGTYYVDVTNTGTTDVVRGDGTITVTVPMPAGLTLASAAGTGWTCTTSGGILVTCTIRRANNSPLTPGSSLARITLTVNVAASAAPGVTTTAAVAMTTDTYAPNNSSTDPTNIPSADLGVTKVVNNNNPATGNQITYTLVVTNYGPSNATNASLTDALPAGLTYNSYTASQGTYTSGTGVWAIGSLAKNAAATLTLTATVTAAVGTAITNTNSALAATEVDPFPGNNTRSTGLTVRYATDLAINKSHTGGFRIGGTGTFTLLVSNAGSANATGLVTVNDTLSAGLTVSSATGAGWTCNAASPLVCTYAIPVGTPLVPGASLNPITLVVNVSGALAPGPIQNTATLTFAGDSLAGNNTSTDTAVLAAQADLRVVKSVSNLVPRAGDALTYTVVVTNLGPDAASNTILTDFLPANLTYNSHTVTQGSYTLANGQWAIGALALNATATLTINTHVNGGLPAGTYLTNEAASLQSDQYDPVPANNALAVYSLVIAPTAVEVASFQATRQASLNVQLQWSLAPVLSVAGFNLYRGPSLYGPYTRLNASLIPAEPGRYHYDFSDTLIMPGSTSYYKVEVIGTDMQPTSFRLLVFSDFGAFLPVLHK